MDKKAEILEAAFRLFCIKGYDLSMSDIAGEVGIKTPSLYSHFSKKDEIIELILRAEIERYYCHLERNIANTQHGGCREAMMRVYLSVFEYFNDINRLRFWRIMPLMPNEALCEICRKKTRENDQIYTLRMRECFERGIQSGEIRADAPAGALILYLAMIQGVLDGMLFYPQNSSRADFIMRVFDAYWDGIRAVPSREG